MTTLHQLIPKLTVAAVFFLLSGTAVSASDEYGIFELVHKASGSYEDTVDAVGDALRRSNLTLHAQHEVRVPDQKQKAQVFILTSPDYRAAAEDESPRTISAQVLRVAVYTWGESQQTLVNMANPVPHAMIFYVDSDNYDELVAAAGRAASDVRSALSAIPGEAVSVQQSPQRSEKHYNKYKGDGPARMMAKFRTFHKSQLLIHSSDTVSVADTATTVLAALEGSVVKDAEEPDGWDVLVQIPFGDSGVYIGVSNPYIEDKMISINSRFRSDGKSDDAPFPGVDHVAALPTDILILNEDGDIRVLHYGQMWRMQLYFWDSGYRAFTLNVAVPSSISNSIKSLLEQGLE